MTNTRKGRKNVTHEVTAIAPETAMKYLQWGYTDEDAVVLEAARGRILQEQRSGLQSIVNAGIILTETKAAIPHGEWGAYVEERLSMSADTVERLMASAKLVKAHPRLLDMADRIRPTALYALARGKGATDEVIGAVIESYADSSEEINAAAVKDTAELINPPKEKAPAKLPFKLIDPILASDENDRLSAMVAQVLKRGSSVGLVYDKVIKSAHFKRWLKTDGAIAALSLAAYAFFLQTCADEDEGILDAMVDDTQE